MVDWKETEHRVLCATRLVTLVAVISSFAGALLMFFGYGVYALFVRPGAAPPQLGLPQWLHVESIGQLKHILAEAIIIVPFVPFLRVALETYVAGAPDFDWNEVLVFLALPVAIALLAAGPKMAQLHPKPIPRSPLAEVEAKASPSVEARAAVPEGSPSSWDQP